MKHFAVFLFCLLFPFLLKGQDQSIHLDWQPMITQESVMGMSVSYITFDGADNMPKFGSLPLYITEAANPDNLYEFKVRLQILSEDTLGAELSRQLADIDLASSEYQVLTTYHNHYATISILPLRLHAGTENSWMLRDFTLSIEPVPAGEPFVSVSRPPIYTNESVLASGSWFKIGVVRSGVHKITYGDLLQMGIDPGQIQTEHIGIFGNYKGMLPEANQKTRPDDLKENAILMVGEEDGTFDEGDYLLFYGQEANTYSYNPFTGRFDHFTNLYTDTTYYFLTPDAASGKRVLLEDATSLEPLQIITTYSDYASHELEKVNLISSGKEWFGERFNGDTLERVVSFHIPDIVEGSQVIMDMEMAFRAFVNTHLQVFYNDALIIDSASISYISNNSSLYARKLQESEVIFNNESDIDILIQYLAPDETSMAWLNYLSLNVTRNLLFRGGQFPFRNPHVVSPGSRIQFRVGQANEDVLLWDITDSHNPRNLTYNLTGSQLDFTVRMDSLREFVLFDHTDYLTPASFEAIPNQNLHGIAQVDFVVVAPRLFHEQAERLAQLHRDHDGLNTLVVEPVQIYNEFSSGSQDIAAIRDFMRMLYLKNAFQGKPPYLLLFGDASFDYKQRMVDNNNMVPTFETSESLRLTQSFVTDDFFGLLDEDEGLNATGTLDVGVGRFPVTTVEEAATAVEKVAHYMITSKQVMDSWRNTICFVADDEDHNLHLHQAEQLVSIVDTLHKGFVINKIYSDAYQKIKVPGGFSYPESNKLIKNQVNEGALVLNYTGHGGIRGWSHEVILDVATINAFDNPDNPPLFITATCEFSRFDDPEFTSAGELVFLNRKGAGIGLLTTTRLAYAHANIILNTRIYEHLLHREDGLPSRLGDLIRLSKIPSNANFLNFSLLGDPALRLAHPQYDIETLKVSNAANGEPADTLKGLNHILVEGRVLDKSGQLADGFNGYLFPTVYDKATRYTTLANSKGSYAEDFYLRDKILFHGKTTVTKGQFSFSFVVPKDISYYYDGGKISYYATDTAQLIDAWGAYDQFVVGGTDEDAVLDFTGPEISVSIRELTMKSAGNDPASPIIVVAIFDEQGVHATGNSLGRDIVMVVDNHFSNSIILNDYFEFDLDSYQSGHLNYQLHDMEPGWHTVQIKAWDLQNNSSEESFDFYVEEKDFKMMSDVKNYPNPFMKETLFSFRHDNPGAYVKKVEIRIFDMSGRNVVNLVQHYTSTNPVLDPIAWDGRDRNGNNLQAGLFVYDVLITDNLGNTAVRHQKLIKLKE